MLTDNYDLAGGDKEDSYGLMINTVQTDH